MKSLKPKPIVFDEKFVLRLKKTISQIDKSKINEEQDRLEKELSKLIGDLTSIDIDKLKQPYGI